MTPARKNANAPFSRAASGNTPAQRHDTAAGRGRETGAEGRERDDEESREKAADNIAENVRKKSQDAI